MSPHVTIEIAELQNKTVIRSQANEGWELVPDRYDDGGFSGGNIERPALKRLIEDIQASKIDCVVVYKVDRLSRSLLDFARVMETFDKFSVSFVSVNAQANGVFPTRESHWYRTSRNHGRAIGPSDQGCRRLVCQAQSWTQAVHDSSLRRQRNPNQHSARRSVQSQIDDR
ncbi:MAG: recombinase family protein [Pirellula sp.]|jgi:hypothetical protein